MRKSLDEMMAEAGNRQVTEPTTIRPYCQLAELPEPQDDWQTQRTFRREYFIASEQYRDAHPFGLRADDLSFDLSTRGRFFFHSCAEKLLPFAKYFEAYHYIQEAYPGRWHGDQPDVWLLADWLEHHAHDVPLWVLAKKLSLAEINRLWFQSKGCEKLDRAMGLHPLHSYLMSLRSSARHWDTGKISWYDIVAFHKFMLSFDFGIAGIEVSIDHTMNGNRCGSAWYTSMFAKAHSDNCAAGFDPESVWHFIDSTFALIVHRDGKHLMTISVAVTKAGVLVNQIQLKQHKGNRWLYKLPKPYFEYALLRVLEACKASGMQMYLSDGVSTAAAVKKSHGENPKNWKQEYEDRIIRIYDQPLHELARASAVSFTVNERNYHRIMPLSQTVQMVAA